MCGYALAVSVPPPEALSSALGDTWATLGMGIVTSIALFMLLIVMGCADGTATLPLGISLGSGETATLGLAKLHNELRAIRTVQEDMSRRVETSTEDLLIDALARLQELEEARGRDPDLSGEQA